MLRAQGSVGLVLVCISHPHDWLARLVRVRPWGDDLQVEDITPDRCGVYILYEKVRPPPPSPPNTFTRGRTLVLPCFNPTSG